MVIFVSHVTHILSALDSILLRVFKKRAQLQLPFNDVSVTTAFIRAACRDLPATIVLPNISGAFYVVGIEFDA
jgi:hypothetical protein